jgi:hypothetical protein
MVAVVMAVTSGEGPSRLGRPERPDHAPLRVRRTSNSLGSGFTRTVVAGRRTSVTTLGPKHQEVIMVRPSILVNRLIGTAAAVSVLLLLAAGRAAALVPDPAEGGRGSSQPLPASPAPTGTSTDLLWIAVTVVVAALVAGISITVLVQRRRTSRRLSGGPATA